MGDLCDFIGGFNVCLFGNVCVGVELNVFLYGFVKVRVVYGV